MLHFAIQIATRLWTVPVVIHHLGIEGYGIWAAITAVVSYLQLGAAGVRSGFQKYVAEATGTSGYEHASRLLSTGTALFGGFSILCCGAVALNPQPFVTLAGIPPAKYSQAAGALSWLAVCVAANNLGAAFQATVAGGHRIDLVRRVGIIVAIAEAIATVLLLRMGYGLAAVAGVFGLSTALASLYGWHLSSVVLPEIKISWRRVDRSLIGECLRFIGSYQLVGALQVAGIAMIPIVTLRVFGAEAAGLYAVVTRLAGTALVPQESLLISVLSSGSATYAEGQASANGAFVERTFRAHFALTVLPLSLVAFGGRDIFYAWTGSSSGALQELLYLTCVASLPRAIASLARVLYRASGGVWADNCQQALVTTCILAAVMGHGGALSMGRLVAGIACAEWIGAIWMLACIRHWFCGVDGGQLRDTAVRIGGGTVVITATSAMVAGVLSYLSESDDRMMAAARSVLFLGTAALVSVPTLWTFGILNAQHIGRLRSAMQLPWPSSKRGAR